MSSSRKEDEDVNHFFTLDIFFMVLCQTSDFPSANLHLRFTNAA